MCKLSQPHCETGKSKEIKKSTMLPITKDMLVSQIIREFPEIRPVLVTYGMMCGQCMGALVESLEDGARMHGIGIEKLVADLNLAVEETTYRD